MVGNTEKRKTELGAVVSAILSKGRPTLSQGG